MFSAVAGRAQLDAPFFFGFAPRDRQMLSDYTAGRYQFDPCGLAMVQRTQAHRPRPRADAHSPVAARDDLIPRPLWYASEHYNLTRRPCRIDEALYSSLTDSRGNLYGLCFIRERGAPRFSKRDNALLLQANAAARRILLTPDSPVHTAAAPAALLHPGPAHAHLPPRLRAVADRLLAGDSCKQAAAHLGLSVHTVVQYAKLLHRQLGVSSRAELLLALLDRRTPPPPNA
jgi:DNA-binding CsgD family transcriptional regulator